MTGKGARRKRNDDDVDEGRHHLRGNLRRRVLVCQEDWEMTDKVWHGRDMRGDRSVPPEFEVSGCPCCGSADTRADWGTTVNPAIGRREHWADVGCMECGLSICEYRAAAKCTGEGLCRELVAKWNRRAKA